MKLSAILILMLVCNCLRLCLFVWGRSGRGGTGGGHQAVWGPGVPAAGEGEQPGGGEGDGQPAAPPPKGRVPPECGPQKGRRELCCDLMDEHTNMADLKPLKPMQDNVNFSARFNVWNVLFCGCCVLFTMFLHCVLLYMAAVLARSILQKSCLISLRLTLLNNG